MKILVLGAGGFLGTNLTIKLYNQRNNTISVFDLKKDYLDNIRNHCQNDVEYLFGKYDENTNFDKLLEEVDIVYHLISTSIPATSNLEIENDLKDNVILTAKLLDACVRQKVKKVVFISSGGAVYGKEANVPLKEDTPTNPISSYGIQKITIEKLLYLYEYLYDLDYRIIRLANPYGPYQRPNGKLGVVTTFIDDAIKNKKLIVYGDGRVVRDFIYIDDAIEAIINIAEGEGRDSNEKIHKVFNVGSGIGKSVNEVINDIKLIFDKPIKVEYKEGRKSDVPVNYLDISLYKNVYGELIKTSFRDGIQKTKEFLENNEE